LLRLRFTRQLRLRTLSIFILKGNSVTIYQCVYESVGGITPENKKARQVMSGTSNITLDLKFDIITCFLKFQLFHVHLLKVSHKVFYFPQLLQSTYLWD
jgi:hypothetical protein